MLKSWLSFNYMNLYSQATKNIRKTWILISLFLIFIIGLGYIFSLVMESRSILIVAVLFSVFMSFFSYWYSDKIVLKITKARLIKPEENKELYSLVENLCQKARLPNPKIAIIEEVAPNAFATGRDPKHAVVAVTTGLLEKLETDELEGVIAHELSHIGNRDILISTIAVILVGFVSLLASWFRYSLWFGRRQGNREEGQAGAILMIAALVLSILAPLIATLIRLAISRKRELLADAKGAAVTGRPEGLARALEKISQDSASLKSASPATAHLFITNPFKKGLMTKLFSTHPPIEERVKILRGEN